MEDVNISKFRAQVVRAGSTPASPGFVVSEGQNPVDPSGSGQNHLPVTIGSPANGLAVTDAQILTIDKAQIFAGTSSQFVKGDGTLDSTAYGTGSVTSVALTMPAAFSVANSPVTTAGTLAVTATGTTSQYIRGDGSLETFPALTGFVPYTGATADVNLGAFDLLAERGTFANNGSSNTLTVNHTSGSGYGIIVTKGGNNEALYVSKTSGSGNAMTVVGGRTSLVDLALSSVTNTAGDFLTLSGGVVHKRTAAQTLTDIGGQAALTNPVTGTGTTNYVPKFTGSTTIGNSNIQDSGTLVSVGVDATFSSNLSIGNQSNIYGGLTGLFAIQNGNSSYYSFDQELGIVGNAYFNSGWKYKTSNRASRYTANVGTHSFEYATSGTANAALTWSAGLFISNSGNVLINTTTDAGYKLDVNGTGRFIQSTNGEHALTNTNSNSGSDAASLINLSNNASVAQFVYTSSTYAGAYDFGANSLAIINRASGSINFVTAGFNSSALRMRITSGGNVGIGTASPNTKLQIEDGFISTYHNINANGAGYGVQFYTNGGGSKNTIAAIEISQDGTARSGDMIFSTSNAGAPSPRMRISSVGNVLIGTATSGASKLRIVGLPTSAVGLSSGDVYNLAGVLMIA
jgi:hypothetical protein